MALRTNNLSSVRVIKRLCWSRCGDVSRCQKATRYNFCIEGIEKSTLAKSINCCLRCQKAIRNN
jgi:hypothetical protein